MPTKEDMHKAVSTAGLRWLSRKIRQSTDTTPPPALQEMINDRKIAIWRTTHRRARGNGNTTTRRAHR